MLLTVATTFMLNSNKVILKENILKLCFPLVYKCKEEFKMENDNMLLEHKQNEILEDIRKLVKKYKSELKHIDFNINSIENLYDTFNNKLFNLVYEKIYNGENFDYVRDNHKHSIYNQESILKSMPNDIKTNVSKSIIDEILRFYNRIIDSYYCVNTTKYLNEINYAIFNTEEEYYNKDYKFYSPFFRDFVIETLICRLGSLGNISDYEPIYKLNSNDKTFICKILNDRQIMASLIIEDNVHLYCIFLDSIVCIGCMKCKSMTEDEFLNGLPNLVDEFQKHSCFDHIEILDAIRSYYYYIFDSKADININSQTLLSLLDSINITNYLLRYAFSVYDE